MSKSGPKPRPAEDRFWDKVDASGDCWVWTAATRDTGYGNFWVGYQEGWCRPHRFAWEALVGPIPVGLDIDHLCRNRLCVNPNHLEPVSRRTNLLRGNTMTAKYAARSNCNYGHVLDGRYATGVRFCRTCKRNYERDRRAARGA